VSLRPQVRVRTLRALCGWVNHARNERWQRPLTGGSIGYLHEEMALDFRCKGYVRTVDSEDEA
jgi:hypothetical protein